MEHQTGDDQSFVDLLDACSDGFLKRQKTDMSSGGPQKNGREQRKGNSSSSASTSDGRDDLLLMVARLTLRQEDTLNQLGLDTSLMMFLQCGRGSIMPTLLVFGRITL